ncbi:ATP-dependent DNA helicase RecG [bacterium]|nr:ATP-dependent DNA helicase RecG [bacterium]
MWSLSETEEARKALLHFFNTNLTALVPLHSGQMKKIVAAVGERVHHILLGTVPLKYEQRVHATSLSVLQPGETVTLDGVISAWKRGFKRVPTTGRVTLKNGSFSVTFFGKVGLRYVQQFPVGSRVLLSGTMSTKTLHPTLTNPELFAFDEVWEELLSGYVPSYRKIPGVSHLFFLRVMRELLKQLSHFKGDWLDSALLESMALPPLVESIQNVHFPLLSTNIDVLNSGLTKWHKRLAYDTLFFLSFGTALYRKRTEKDKNRSISAPSSPAIDVEKSLPFALTTAQSRVLAEIRSDLQKSIPMSRLLQGDVGSGKTVVMLLAGLDIVDAGYKTLIMAPTEILAKQHLKTIESLLPERYKTTLLVGSLGKGKKAKKAMEQVADSHFIIGTHALYERLDEMSDIGLVIIDEQHRFGVGQRMKLIEKGDDSDILVVSATPIPRSLALTLFGGIEISVIDEMPPGREAVNTRFVMHNKRTVVIEYVRAIIEENGRRGYWVCPLVEESEKMDLKHVEGVFEELFELFGGRVALLHGRMKAEEKDRVLNQLRDGTVSVLVSTVVIEVGVDIPDASFIVIENAERFGLAQLHQLRGRVGRGAIKSFCALLASEDISEKASNRLTFLSENHSGFKIAEYDLSQRGPGALTGVMQSGFKNDPYFLVAARYGVLIEKSRGHAYTVFSSEKRAEIEEWFAVLHKEKFMRYRSG